MTDLASGGASATFFTLLFIYLAALATVPWLAARRRRGAPTWFALALIPSLLAGVGALGIGWLAVVAAAMPFVVLAVLGLLPPGGIEVPKVEGLKRLQASTLLAVYLVLGAAVGLAALVVDRVGDRDRAAVLDSAQRRAQALTTVLAEQRSDGLLFEEWLRQRLVRVCRAEPEDIGYRTTTTVPFGHDDALFIVWPVIEGSDCRREHALAGVWRSSGDGALVLPGGSLKAQDGSFTTWLESFRAGDPA